MKIKNLEVITIGVKCPSCGRVWGINLVGIAKLEDVPASKLVCMTCFEKFVELNKVK